MAEDPYRRGQGHSPLLGDQGFTADLIRIISFLLLLLFVVRNDGNDGAPAFYRQ